MIRIIAKRNGFRRAGVTHVGDKLWPDDAFSPGQLAALTAEPNLIVEALPGEECSREEADPAGVFPEETEDGKLLLNGEEALPAGEVLRADPEDGKPAAGKGKK